MGDPFLDGWEAVRLLRRWLEESVKLEEDSILTGSLSELDYKARTKKREAYVSTLRKLDEIEERGTE